MLDIKKVYQEIDRRYDEIVQIKLGLGKKH